VQSIAIIHDHLYQLSDLSNINFEEYVKTLINHVCRSYGITSQQIAITIAIQALNLNLNQAIACGLIINELVSNSLKYAFFNSPGGKITICLHRLKTTDSRGILLISDNGCGISPDFNWQTCQSLGLRIVRTLVEQINGTIELDRQGGTTFAITFAIEPV